MLLGFAKAHHKITPGRKRLHGPGLGKLPKILGFPFNIFATAEASDFKFGMPCGYSKDISATAEASDFKFGMQLGFAKGHHKISPVRKSGRSLGLGKLPKILGFPFNITAITPRRKSGRGPGLEKLSNILGFPFNIFVTAEASDFKFGVFFGVSKAHHKITL